MRFILHSPWPASRQNHLIEVVRRLKGPYPRYIVEPRPGKRNALIPGLRPLETDHVIITLYPT